MRELRYRYCVTSLLSNICDPTDSAIPLKRTFFWSTSKFFKYCEDSFIMNIALG